ncbi:MAG: hypothetical protein V2I33_19970, partial [Kangiellaceae bacterium]|nr:hypothetical protein [Kangiellaceae bacterium]
GKLSDLEADYKAQMEAQKKKFDDEMASFRSNLDQDRESAIRLLEEKHRKEVDALNASYENRL